MAASTAKMQGGLIEYDFKPSLRIVGGNLREIGYGIKSFREPLRRAIKEVMGPSFTKNFDAGGRPKWAPIAESTVEFQEILARSGKGKNRRGKGRKGVLVQTGALRQTMGQLNIWTISTTDATITSLPGSVWYGAVHQAGYAGGNAPAIPARPFVLFQPEDEEEIAEVFGKWLDERIERAYPR